MEDAVLSAFCPYALMVLIIRLKKIKMFSVSFLPVLLLEIIPVDLKLMFFLKK